MEAYENAVRVAAHRGNSKFFPENTMPAYLSALQMPIDQIEIDLHMSRDGEIMMMHDAKLDRTTDGTGLLREYTYAELQRFDAGAWKGAAFRGTRIPAFREFLELLRDYPEMTVNVELKDYPTAEEKDWAYTSCRKTLSMIEDAGMRNRVWINSFSGEILELIDRETNHGYKLHGYFPHTHMSGEMCRDPYDYLHCVCLFGTKENPVVDKSEFDRAKERSVEPWCHFPGDEIENFEAAIANGCMLFTCNDPMKCLTYLHSRGLHSL